jgi:protein TonB
VADADALRQYRLALAREARRFRSYPERARLAGIAGTAEVHVELAAGLPPVARLAHTSGNDALDAAAVDMMRRAAPRTTLPEQLRGRSLVVSLPVLFELGEE